MFRPDLADNLLVSGLISLLVFLSLVLLILLLERWTMQRVVRASRREKSELYGRLARCGESYQSLLAESARATRGVLVDERGSVVPGLDPLSLVCLLAGLAGAFVLSAWVLLPMRVVLAIRPRLGRFFDRVSAFAVNDPACAHCGRDAKVLGRTAHSVWFYCECGHHWRDDLDAREPAADDASVPLVAGVGSH